MKTAIVLTTVNVPDLLHGYADNFERYGHKTEVEFIIIGDLKTPPEVEELAEAIRKRGFEADYLDIARQEDWLRKFPDLMGIIPYNSDNRRNIGYLLAVERGADIIISLDDDNYVMDGDFLEAHRCVGSTNELRAATSSNGWFNLCSLLETEPAMRIYPRGFPYSKRWGDDARFTTDTGRVVLNAGLWLGDPDVDAVTRLSQPVTAVGLNSHRVMLSPGTFTAINTQNTAFHKDILPCYYYIEMGAIINGTKLDRYGDIWAGFFALKVINHMNDRVTIGAPCTLHRRNKHNLLKDLQDELWGMLLTDQVAPIIESLSLAGTTYEETYIDLAEKLKGAVISRDDFSQEVKDYLIGVTKAMKIWVDVCKELR